MSNGPDSHGCEGPGWDLNRRHAAVEAVWEYTMESNKAESLQGLSISSLKRTFRLL